MRLWIGFTGYARSGKDTAVKLMQEIDPRFRRISLGDIIKENVDSVLQAYTGISAFTEDPVLKSAIRGFLVYHGYYWYDQIFDMFKERARAESFLLNNRVFRLQEARWWKQQGGFICHVVRPNLQPAEAREEYELQTLLQAGLIDAQVVNGGSIEDLKAQLKLLYLNFADKALNAQPV